MIPNRSELLERFPSLVALRRDAARLHPRPGISNLGASSFGAPALLRSGEPWPTCGAVHGSGDNLDRAGIPESMVLGLRLLRSEVPGLPFRGEEDLCQIFWCPLFHGRFWEPRVEVMWQFSSHRRDLRPVPYVRSAHAVADYVPSPCSISPEMIPEYPSDDELPEELRSEVGSWADERGIWYSDLAAAPGSKVGGYACWRNGDQTPTCAAGHRMVLLVTVASYEDDPESYAMWGREPGGNGLNFDDAGDLHIFICTICDNRPIVSLIAP